MKIPVQSNTKQRRYRFGSGVLFALIVAGALIASGRLSTRRPVMNAGRVVYEADSKGRMRRVATPSSAAEAPLPPLRKPEVGLLLDRASALRLTLKQRRILDVINAAWLRDKRNLQAAMDRAATGATGGATRIQRGRGASLTLLRQGFMEYSALSRQYNALRDGYWRQAKTVLTTAQGARLNDAGAIAERTRL